MIARAALRAPYATPLVRQIARQLGVDLGEVQGRGSHGRIGAEDVYTYVRASMAKLARLESASATPAPAIDFAKFGAIELQPLTTRKQAHCARLQRAWSTIPHVTNFDEVDVTALEAFLPAIGDAGEFGMAAFLMKALARALREFPAFNASLAGAQVVLKQYAHVGFEVETPDGEVTPVVRDVERKSLSDIAQEAAALAAKARAGSLDPNDLQGGCITVSHLGDHGSLRFTRIIHAPEVAILGAGRVAWRPRWNGAAFASRRMLPLCLSWDHRAVDGAAAARFLAEIASSLSDFRRMLL